MLEESLRGVVAIVAAKGTPEESAAFGAWLVAAAKASAEAAKDGGFLGFGAQQVSDRRAGDGRRCPHRRRGLSACSPLTVIPVPGPGRGRPRGT